MLKVIVTLVTVYLSGVKTFSIRYESVDAYIIAHAQLNAKGFGYSSNRGPCNRGNPTEKLIADKPIFWCNLTAFVVNDL